MTRDTKQNLPEGAVYLRNDEGRKYNMGTMKAVFKADEAGKKWIVSLWVPYKQRKRNDLLH